MPIASPLETRMDRKQSGIEEPQNPRKISDRRPSRTKRNRDRRSGGPKEARNVGRRSMSNKILLVVVFVDLSMEKFYEILYTYGKIIKMQID